MERLFVVDTLLGPGLHLLAGSPKVGKSWLALWLTVCIAKGESIWEMAVTQGETLYLCLEDSEARIQARLLGITEYVPANCHFCTQALSLGKGLEEQVESFMEDHPDTVLITIDTVQKVRSVTWDSTYANDYKELAALKELADRYGIAILLIHHLRKEDAPDVFNRISGTTAMQGVVDSSFTLVEETRGSGQARLYCVGRDIEYRELDLKRNAENIWDLVSDSRNRSEQLDRLVPMVQTLLEGQSELRITPTDLADRLNTMREASDDVFTNRTVARRLMENHTVLSSLGIGFRNYQSNGKRLVRLWRRPLYSDDGDDEPGCGGGTQISVSIGTGTVFL